MISINNLSNNQELITGIREDGTIYSIYSFARKVGQAVAGGLGGFALSAVGYDATLKVQTASTLHGIFSLNTILMGVGYAVVGLILLFFYPLNKKRTLQLTVDLTEKRKASLESINKLA